jgi:hypothetical protein
VGAIPHAFDGPGVLVSQAPAAIESGPEKPGIREKPDALGFQHDGGVIEEGDLHRSHL